LLYTV